MALLRNSLPCSLMGTEIHSLELASQATLVTTEHYRSFWLRLPSAGVTSVPPGLAPYAGSQTQVLRALWQTLYLLCGLPVLKDFLSRRAVVAHACNPSTLGGRDRQISEFEASLVYRVSSCTARDIQRNPVSKKSQIPKIKWSRW